MKRTPLQRRSAPLRRTRLKARPKPRLTPTETAERTAFKLAYIGETCAACRLRLAQVSHHVVYEQHLRPEHKFRLENALPLCHSCHNNHHSANGPKVRREWLSESHLNFASEMLGGSAGTYLARRYR